MATAKKIIDPLTFKPLREGSIVELKSDNGAIFKFKVVRVDADDESVVLQKSESKLIALVQSDRVVINQAMTVGKALLHPGDKVLLKYKDGSAERFDIDVVFNNDLLVISKPGRKKLGLLDKMKFIWKTKGL